MNYKLKIPKKVPSNYYWYFYRCLTTLANQGIINIEYFNSPIDEQYLLLFYFNDRPIFIDVRDDNRLSQTYASYSDAIILKSNYSSELWDNPPQLQDLINADWEHKIRPRIHPYVLGRTFNGEYTFNELEAYSRNQEIKYDLVSMVGTGITNESTLNRLNTYEFLQANVPNAQLIFWLRKHGIPNEKIHPDIIERANKFNITPILGLNEYFKFLSTGRFSLNIPGITCSQPFRFVDAVLVNRITISTKIWQDIYKSFPCIELPIDTYFNIGDWEAAKEALNRAMNLSNEEYNKILTNAKHWYSWYLSPMGMWNNQILKQLEQ